MSLEALMERLITSLDANTAAHTGKVAPAATAAVGKPSAPAKPGLDFESVKAAGVKVKEKLGAAAAKKLIETAGKAKSLADVKPEAFAALMAAFDAAMAPAAEPEDDGEL